MTVARALDAGKLEEARDCLRSFPLVRCDPSQRRVAFAFWKRILAGPQARRRPRNLAPLRQELFPGPDNFGVHDPDEVAGQKSQQILEALDALNDASSATGNLWKAYHAIPVLEANIGAVDTAAIVVTTLWDFVLEANPAFFECVFELLFRAGGERGIDAWQQILAAQRDYIPLYWHFVLLANSVSGSNQSDSAAIIARALRNSGRAELAPLFDVYIKQMRQAPVSEIVAAARSLESADQRNRVADYMVEIGYMPEELPIAVAAIGDLSGNSDAGKDAASFMLARLANAENRWRDVLGITETLRTSSRYRHAADLLRAQALARLNETERANELLDSVIGDKRASRFLHARAAFLRVTTELVARGLPLPEQRAIKPLPHGVGRPLAQSLWIGRRLRWIERLAIKSYLDNGWRFQLYTYDEVANVPEGCEVLDASVIIPAKDVFREGRGSGVHTGSIGAYSDLFRYKLLLMRGGMWTDTDVINFKRYDPEGQRFICTEISDAAVVTLNGAVMAAPAGDEFVARAYERARQLLAENDRMFFTRIGPYLLAELVVEFGADKIELMPPAFLSPISWLNAASLLQPFDAVMSRLEFQQTVNLHVYTETWRTLGLGLGRPPSPTSFLGRLYAAHFGEEASPREAVNA